MTILIIMVLKYTQITIEELITDRTADRIRERINFSRGQTYSNSCRTPFKHLLDKLTGITITKTISITIKTNITEDNRVEGRMKNTGLKPI